MTTITKKTTLLAGKPVVSLDEISLVSQGGGAHMAYLTVTNPAGVKEYSYDPGTEMENVNALISINGGTPNEQTFHGGHGQSTFSALVGNIYPGDTVKAIIELDPAKAGEYRAGTMEQTITIS